MKHGRTSMISFLSQVGMSVFGFVATIVLTRTLGPEQYGIYVLTLSLLSWGVIAGSFGLEQALRKRMSEANGGNYITAGALIQLALYGVVAVILWLGRGFINGYVGADVTLVLIVLLAARLTARFVFALLDGQRLVHISSLLTPVEWLNRSTVQVALVLAGFGITGAFVGYVVGAIVASVVGLYFATVRLTPPSRREIADLHSYARFSWLTSLKGQAFVSMDTVILAFFTTNAVVGVYQVAWNLASLFATFGSAISRTLFPEISAISSGSESPGEVSDLLRISLSYAGLFTTPGLVGGAIVGDVVLSIYGPSFRSGYVVLVVLTLARLVYGYLGQILNTIDGVDRPDLSFRVNASFVAVNLLLNIVLTSQFGWYGAAAATATSAVVGLALGYYYVRGLVDVALPLSEISKQWFSAGLMAVVVLAGRLALGDSLALILALIGVGAAIYFVTLFSLSGEFRTTVESNLPIDVPIPHLR